MFFLDLPMPQHSWLSLIEARFQKLELDPRPRMLARQHQDDMIIFRLRDSYKPVFATVPGYLEDHPNLSRVASLPNGLNGEMVVTNH